MTKIILDCCNNHLGYPEILVAMIHEAKRLRADYVKFQLYNHDTLSTMYPDYRGYKQTLKQCQITSKKLKIIFNECEKMNITPMFTLFSEDRVPFLNQFKGRKFAVKIASPDMMNISLIKKVLDSFYSTCNVFISCGLHTDLEIQSIKEHLAQCCIDWLYCVSMYPTPIEYINFEKMKQFDGFSDHTTNVEAALHAIALKVSYVEMHFTLGKSLPCKDSLVSKVPSEIERVVNMRNYVDSIDRYKSRFTKGVL